MNDIILPSNPLTGKTYRNFDIQFRKGTKFFYIGTNGEKINLLTEAFGDGCHCDDPATAILILQHLIGTQSIPDLVIIDGGTAEFFLKKLNNLITAGSSYSATPFVLDVCGIPEQKAGRYKCFQFLDEIMLLNRQNLHGFVTQVEFLKRIKKQSCRPASGSIQRSQVTVFDSTTVLKRMLDILISLMAIIVLSPVFLLIALAVKLDSQGSVLYVSKRAGRGYKVFNFYKFRTMIADADKNVKQLHHLNQYNAPEEEPVFFKMANDPRITRVGALLRKTSMDELPQFFNVLLGDMSLVGNRPLPLDEAAALTTDNWAARFMAPAGMTGLWQIKRKQYDQMSVEKRICLDIDYANKYNFMYDLWIMANTPSALIQKSNS